MKFFEKNGIAVTDPATRNTVWWSVLILLPAAHYLGSVLHLNYPVPGVLAFLLWAVLPRTGRVVTDRAVIYSFVAALALTAFGNYLSVTERVHYPFSFYFLRLRVTGPLALFGAALAARYRRKMHLLGLSFLAVFLIFGVGYDAGYSPGLQREWKFGSQGCSFQAFYWSHALPALAGLWGALFWYDHPFRFRTLCRFAAALAAALFLAAAGICFQQFYRGDFQKFSDLLIYVGRHQSQLTIDPWSGRRSLLGGNIRQPNPPESREEREEILFFIQGKTVPRYWRMTVFSSYRRGGWSSAEVGNQNIREVVPELSDVSRPIDRADQRYLLIDVLPRRLTRAELYFGAWRNPSQLPVPGSAVMLTMVADTVGVTREGLIQTTGMVADAGCTFYCDPSAPEAGQEPLPPEWQDQRVPRNLRALLRNTALLAGVLPGERDAATATHLIRYLREHCRYSSDWPGAPFFLDPVQFFLEEHPSGHCELFASALVLLLRQSGIPARYVAGALCYEEAGGRGRYVIRRRHLHAWVEAFDRDRGEWVLLDPTPGGGNETAAEAAGGTAAAWQLRLRHDWAAFLAGLRRGHWIGWLAGPVYAAYEKITADPGPWLRGIGIMVSVWLLLRRYRKWRRERRSRAYLTRELNRCGRRLARRGVIPKGAWRNLSAAEMLPAVQRTPLLSEAERREAEEFLQNYLKRRFG